MCYNTSMEKDYQLKTIVDNTEYVFDEDVVITNEPSCKPPRLIVYVPEIDLELTLSGVSLA